MKQFIAACLLALLSAGSISAQEAGIKSGGQEITTTVGGQETGAPTPTVVPAGLTPEEHQYLATTARNLEILASRPFSRERHAEVRREVNVTNNYITQRHIVQQVLSPSQLVQMLKDLHYLRSGASTWGKYEVKFCLDEGILVGRNKGATPASAEWKMFVSREELAAAQARQDRRVDGKIAGAIAAHNMDNTSHLDIRRWLSIIDHKVNWIIIVPIILFLIWLLCHFLRWLWRRLHPAPPPPPVVPVVAPIVAPAPVPPGLGPAPVPPAPGLAPVAIPPAPVPAFVPYWNNTGC